MGYRGGKVKIGEEIAQFINDKVVSSENKRGKDYDGYCEPFCGYCGVYRHIPDLLGDDLEYLGGYKEIGNLQKHAVNKSTNP